MPRYRALTQFVLEGEPIRDGELLPQAWVDEPANKYQLDQWLEQRTIIRLPDAAAKQSDVPR